MAFKPVALPTPFQRHVAKYRDCRACDLCHGRTQVVFARGSVPADVLLTGEAPGESEDTLGQPFRGPAGQLLDTILARAIPTGVTYCLTNMICCIPYDESGHKVAEPPDAAVKACAPRLQEFVGIVKPRLLVAVGTVARDWLDPKRKHRVEVPPGIPQVSIVHPAAIIRAMTVQRGLMIQRAVVTLANAVQEYVTGEQAVTQQEDDIPF